MNSADNEIPIFPTSINICIQYQFSFTCKSFILEKEGLRKSLSESNIIYWLCMCCENNIFWYYNKISEIFSI